MTWLWVDWEDSGEQETPQRKAVRRGRAQGSTAAKFHEERQEEGGMEEGVMEDLKALSAWISEGGVSEWNRGRDVRRIRRRECADIVIC